MSDAKKTPLILKDIGSPNELIGTVEPLLSKNDPQELIYIQLDPSKYPNRLNDFPLDVRKYLMTHPRVKVEWDDKKIETIGQFDLDDKVQEPVPITKPKIVVTMTSWKKRIGNCIEVIQSILDNTVKPDIIFLNLSTEEFPNLCLDIPPELMKMCMTEQRVKINWVTGRNTKSLKKVFPILKYVNNDDIIIYTDDDILMPRELIESRLKDYSLYHQPITGRRMIDFNHTLYDVFNIVE